jgi:predicted  nucleic acid-binding Zn-ribbon protein
MATNDSSKQRLLAIAAVVVVALLAINAFLLYNKYTQDRVVDEQKTELAEADKLKIELEKQYHEALSELEEMRTSNEELNAIIDQQKAELKLQKDKIDGMIKGGTDLSKARSELKNMKAQLQGYVAQIEQLKGENAALAAERDQLSQRAQALSTNLDSAQARNQLLVGEKTALTTEKEQLSAERNKLVEKVNLASVIKVENVSVTGLKERNSGKTVKKKYAKNVDQLKICFKTTENEIVRPGVEQFFVRILTPVGETMSVDELGSGKMIDKETGDEIPYTYLKEYDYNHDAADICFNWDPNLGAFSKGIYKVQVYNKGHLAGTGEFQLK